MISDDHGSQVLWHHSLTQPGSLYNVEQSTNWMRCLVMWLVLHVRLELANYINTLSWILYLYNDKSKSIHIVFEININLLVILASGSLGALSKSLRKAMSASWVITAMTLSASRNMENSRCFWRVRTLMASFMRPNVALSRDVTSAHGMSSFTTCKQKNQHFFFLHFYIYTRR